MGLLTVGVKRIQSVNQLRIGCQAKSRRPIPVCFGPELAGKLDVRRVC